MTNQSTEGGSQKGKNKTTVPGCPNCLFPEGRSAIDDYAEAIWADVDKDIPQTVIDYLARRATVARDCKFAETGQCALSAAGILAPDPPTT
jgi:hypothetical protein